MGEMLDYFNKQKKKEATKSRVTKPAKSVKTTESTQKKELVKTPKKMQTFLDNNINKWFTATEIGKNLGIPSRQVTSNFREEYMKRVRVSKGKFLYSSVKTTSVLKEWKDNVVTPVNVTTTPIVTEPAKKKSFMRKFLEALLLMFED